MIANEDDTKSSWAGSFESNLLFRGSTREGKSTTLDWRPEMRAELTSHTERLPSQLAEIPQKMNFHFQVFREKYNFPIVTAFQC